MKEVLYNEIPSLDLAGFVGGDVIKKIRFANDLGAAYTSIGFVSVRNHFPSPAIQEDLYAAIRKFFAPPDNIRQHYEVPGLAGRRGYTGKSKDNARGSRKSYFNDKVKWGKQPPRSDMSLACLDSCVNAQHPKQFEDITAGAFLDMRLVEIGLKK